MLAKDKHRIIVDEDKEIVAQIDAIAHHEGITRSDVLRRAIRNLVFSLPNVPINGNNSYIGTPCKEKA